MVCWPYRGLEMVVCEEGGVLNEMGSPTPLCVFPSNPAPNSTDWVLKEVAELQECVGISCVGFEEQFNALLVAIKAGHSTATKSVVKKR